MQYSNNTCSENKTPNHEKGTSFVFNNQESDKNNQDNTDNIIMKNDYNKLSEHIDSDEVKKSSEDNNSQRLLMI